MKIKMADLRENYTKLTKYIEEYSILLNNYYNELNFVPNYWKSPKANYFLQTTSKEKIDNKQFYIELSSFCELYNFLLEKYADIDEEIYINEDGEDSIVEKILQNTFDTILSKYDAVSTTASNVIDKRIAHKNKLSNNKKGLLDYKDNLKKYYDFVKETEDEFTHKLTDFSLAKIYSNTPEEKSIGTTDEMIYEIAKIGELFEKMKKYYREFEENYKNIQIILDELKECYNSKNSELLNDIHIQVINKYKMIKSNINNNVELLKKNFDSLMEATNAMKLASERLGTNNG